MHYYLSPKRIRLPSHVVSVGDVPLGGDYPLRIQSMTNTDTNDIKATVMQAEQLARAGCNYVRITAQGIKEAKNLAIIKKELKLKGITVPLIADIHFNPKAAETAARLVEKVRINPGNYILSAHRPEYSMQEYNDELDLISTRLKPLLEICLQYGTALRIGVNHGSLGQRILSRFGDTPEGMAESAMEYLRICLNHGFQNIVLSLKSSNVRVMIYATRLLAEKMLREGTVYPLHLGVTEAGNGMDGIVKSAAGLGALLMDGIGDTLRVSLTGDPLSEIPVAKAIVNHFENKKERINKNTIHLQPDPFSYKKRETHAVKAIGGSNPVQVIARKDEIPCLVDENGSACGVVTQNDFNQMVIPPPNARNKRLEALTAVNNGKPIVLLNTFFTKGMQLQVEAAIEAGSLLVDGIGDAVWIDAPEATDTEIADVSFSILQATRARITRTEFISCPSCGRTLFDIEDMLQNIKSATGHLTGLKIAVMGCIVNGPGEMADADYGLVGAGPGKITLYKSNKLVLKNIPISQAAASLIEVIKSNGDWTEPSGQVPT